MRSLQKKEIMVLINNAGYDNQVINAENIKLNFAFSTILKNTYLISQEKLEQIICIFNKSVSVVVNNKGKFEIKYNQIKNEKEFVITTAKSILSIKNQKQNQKYKQNMAILEK